MARAAAPKTPPARAWQRMLSGRRLDLLNPSPLDIEIADIAHGLARVARWNGQTKGPNIFSVAQHSLLVEAFAQAINPDLSARWRMMVLLHDAPEYVIGDIISPFKAVLGHSYKNIENNILSAIHLRFGLPAAQPAPLAKLANQADRAAAFVEATRQRILKTSRHIARRLDDIERDAKPDVGHLASLASALPRATVARAAMERLPTVDEAMNAMAAATAAGSTACRRASPSGRDRRARRPRRRRRRRRPWRG